MHGIIVSHYVSRNNSGITFWEMLEIHVKILFSTFLFLTQPSYNDWCGP